MAVLDRTGFLAVGFLVADLVVLVLVFLAALVVAGFFAAATGILTPDSLASLENFFIRRAAVFFSKMFFLTAVSI